MELKSEKLRPTLMEFISNCNHYTLYAIQNIYENNFNDIEEYSLRKIRLQTEDFLSHVSKKLKSANYEDLETSMEMKKLYQLTLELLTDLEKLKKLFKKRNIDTTYREILSFLNRLIEEQVNALNEQMIKSQFFRIKNTAKEDITLNTVIKEIIQSPLDIKKDENNIKKILNKFNLDYNPSTLPRIIKEIIDDEELVAFEKKLGINNSEHYIDDYKTLNGYEFESFLKELFTALGFIVVKTPLSNDQGADLILSKDGILTVVQAKKYSSKVSNKAIQEVVAAKSLYNCEKALVVATNYFTKSAIELAISNKVELWDQKKLDATLENINKSPNQNLDGFKNGIIEDGYLNISCTACLSKDQIVIDQLPQRNKRFRTICPVCEIPYFIEIPDDFFICQDCNQEFDSIKDLQEHYALCKIL